MNYPLVEKYRPNHFSKIVLEEENHLFFSNIIKLDYIPNMLFYGPPGTGKTTSIINLIHQYQKLHDEESSGLMIHLNASDDRGIDTIRIQLNSFIQSKNMFKKGTKFIILDEVDSMTRAAQLSLSYLLHEYANVTVCLICNYISKVETSLQSMFLKVKFNHLPPKEILSFLKYIVQQESLPYTDDQLLKIQRTYGSDIRSMINHIQIHVSTDIMCIQEDTWDTLYETIRSNKDEGTQMIYTLSSSYNMDIKHLLKDFLYYIVLKHSIPMNDLAILLHTPFTNEHCIRYVINKLI
jgi:replication factor C subunit 3/5